MRMEAGTVLFGREREKKREREREIAMKGEMIIHQLRGWGSVCSE